MCDVSETTQLGRDIIYNSQTGRVIATQEIAKQEEEEAQGTAQQEEEEEEAQGTAKHHRAHKTQSKLESCAATPVASFYLPNRASISP